MIIGIFFYTFSLFLPSLCFSPSFLSYLRALVFSPQKRWWLVCSTRKSEIQTKSNFSLAFPPSPFVINRPLPRFTTQYSKHYHHIVLSKISVFVFPLSLSHLLLSIRERKKDAIKLPYWWARLSLTAWSGSPLFRSINVCYISKPLSPFRTPPPPSMSFRPTELRITSQASSPICTWTAHTVAMVMYISEGREGEKNLSFSFFSLSRAVTSLGENEDETYRLRMSILRYRVAQRN